MKTITLFVSPAGSDRWSGLRPEPRAGRSDGPLATIEAAQRRARALKRRGGRVEVRLRGGVYELAKTWTLGPDDSGSRAAPVVYAAYPGERPVISGGRRITGWRPGKVNGRSCWVADLPEVRRGAWRFTQLFVDGRRHLRTRWPREGYSRFAGFAGERDSAFEWYKGPRRVEYRAGDFRPAWRNRDDIRMVALQLWFDMHFRIARVDSRRRAITFSSPAIGSLRDETGKPARYYVENVFEQVREPGDWYVDRREGRLYYIPQPGQTPENTGIVAPRLRTLLECRGVPDGRRAAHIRFENLDFRHCDYEVPADCAGYVQAAHGVPGAIVLSDAEDCVLYGCAVSLAAQYGVEVRRGSRGNRIVACDLYDLGAGGVKLSHESAGAPNAVETGTRARRKPVPPGRTLVSDCAIHDAGVLFPSAIGIWIGQSGRNRIFHNHIFNLNYTGISCGWQWGYKDTPAIDNRIEYNRIHHINDRRILSDNGGIYTLGVQPGTRLVGNVLHDIDCYGYGGWGIYPDEGSSEMRFENNLVYRTKAGSFSVHYGRDYLCRNNIFALAQSQIINLGKAESHRCGVFERNVVYWNKGGVEATAGDWDLNNYLCRDNLFYPADGGPPSFNGRSVPELQARGQHLGLVNADPLFAAPGAGDFTLRADSPARAIGFRPFDPGRAGPRLAGRRPASFDDWPHDRVERPEPQVSLRLACDTARGVRRARGGSLRVRFALTLWNLGGREARGRLALAPSSEAGPVALDTRRLAVRLAPGARQRRMLTARVPAGARTLRVECQAAGAGFLPACLVVNLVHVFPVEVPTLSRTPAADELPARLVAIPAHALCAGDAEGGRLRLALTPAGLAVWVQVEDRELRPQPRAPWTGSGIELFVAPERPELDDRAIDRKMLSQVHLMPRAGGAPARVARQEEENVALKANVPAWSRRTADGYEFAAVLPLGLLKLPRGTRAFRFEAVANAVSAAGAPRRAFKLFGAGYPAGNALDYGHIRAGGVDRVEGMEVGR